MKIPSTLFLLLSSNTTNSFVKVNISCFYITIICIYDQVQKYICSNWFRWIAAFSVWHMKVQYYMKKWSWYVNINFSIYVLTLRVSNSDNEKDPTVHLGILKDKMTAWFQLIVGILFFDSRWFDKFRHGINSYQYLVIILGQLLWQSIYFCFNFTGYNLHISLSIFKVTPPDMRNVYFRCLVWETAICVTFKVMWDCLDF